MKEYKFSLSDQTTFFSKLPELTKSFQIYIYKEDNVDIPPKAGVILLDTPKIEEITLDSEWTYSEYFKAYYYYLNSTKDGILSPKLHLNSSSANLPFELRFSVRKWDFSDIKKPIKLYNPTLICSLESNAPLHNKLIIHTSREGVRLAKGKEKEISDYNRV